MEENEINPVFFEQILIKLIFIDEEVRDRILPYLTYSVFDDPHNIVIVKKILDFYGEYNKIPSLKEMKLFLNNPEHFQRLKEIMLNDLKDYTHEFILGMIETWFKGKKINEVNAEITENLISGEMENVAPCVDKLREACSFSFNNNVGIDVFDSPEELYEFFHNKDKIISSGLTSLDNLIDGGFHEKSLALFMSECVDENTIVKIRVRKKI